MLCDETAESAGKDARELGAALVGAHAFRVTPGVRFDVFVVGHGHYGDPAKRGPSEMTYAVCSRVLRKVITRGSPFASVPNVNTCWSVVESVGVDAYAALE